jgi:GAF domain-containing protein
VVGVLNASASNTETFYSEDDLRVLCILAEHAGIVAAKARDTDRVVRLIRRMRKRHQTRMAEAGLMPSPEIDRRDAA